MAQIVQFFRLELEATIEKAPVKIGEVLAGKYRVERVLGVGGMGVVVAAWHLQLDKMVALKFMLEEASEDPDVSARFAREAKAASRLRTQHVTKVLDVGTLDSGAPYMVMEFLEGLDLRQCMRERRKTGKGPMPTERAVDYIMQACLGMAEAHSHEFVHRDLKPSNLFLTRAADGRPLIKILDFGIAKAAIDGIDTCTQAIMGSPVYMPPEQWEGARHVDERGDIWALGAILHCLLSGRPPFHGESLPVLFKNISEKEPRSLALPELGVPARLQAIVRRCLAKYPGLRPQSVAELAGLLAPFGSHEAAEYASKANRLASAGMEGTIMGQGACLTPAPGLHTQGDTIPDDLTPTAATTLSQAGQFPDIPTLPEQLKARKWVPLVGVAIVLMIGVGFGALVEQLERARRGPQRVTSAAAATSDPVPEPVAEVPESELPVAEVLPEPEPEVADPVAADSAPTRLSSVRKKRRRDRKSAKTKTRVIKSKKSLEETIRRSSNRRH